MEVPQTPSVPCRFPSAEQSCHRGIQGGKPPIPPPGIPGNDPVGHRTAAYAPSSVLPGMGCCGVCGAAALRGAQVLHTPAALLAVFHMTVLPALPAPAFNHINHDLKRQKILQKVGRTLSLSAAQGHKTGMRGSPVCSPPAWRHSCSPQPPQDTWLPARSGSAASPRRTGSSSRAIAAKVPQGHVAAGGDP